MFTIEAVASAVERGQTRLVTAPGNLLADELTDTKRQLSRLSLTLEFQLHLAFTSSSLLVFCCLIKNIILPADSRWPTRDDCVGMT
jgi:hypothetical protein